MRLGIHHQTHYHYSQPVFLEPHYLNLYPQSYPQYTVTNFRIEVTPRPSGLSQRMSAENNQYFQCWFDELTSSLQVEVQFEAQLREINAFDFFIDVSQQEKKPSDPSLKPFLHHGVKIGSSMRHWVETLALKSDQDPLKLFSLLLDEIHDHWGHEIRYEATLHSPAYCFEKKNGSCRDLSWMLIHALRLLHIPARFVSGYAHNPELGEGHELHAWVEAWLPGAGWIGLDPSAGLFTSEAYIPLAVSHHPKNTMPVIGNYRGDARSRLETEVRIVEL